MKPRDQDRLLIVGICAACIAALGYAALATVAFLTKSGVTIKEFDGAAWTQAVGSVGAILVLVWVSRHERVQARRSERAQELNARLSASKVIGREMLSAGVLVEEARLGFGTAEHAILKLADRYFIQRCLDAREDLVAACRQPLPLTGAAVMLVMNRDEFRELVYNIEAMRACAYIKAPEFVVARGKAMAAATTFQRNVKLMGDMQTKLEQEVAAAESLCR